MPIFKPEDKLTIKVHQSDISNKIEKAQELAWAIARRPSRPNEFLDDSLQRALDLSLDQVNAMLSADGTECTIDAPPTSAVKSVVAGSGDIVYRCGHSPDFHEWDLTGHRIK